MADEFQGQLEEKGESPGFANSNRQSNAEH